MGDMSRPHAIPYTNQPTTTIMRWRSMWEGAGTAYHPGDVVRDGEWVMVANAQTTDRPAPTPVGDPIYLFNGTDTIDTDTSNILLFGSRYTWDGSAFLNAWRLYTVTGQTYAVFLVTSPGAAGEEVRSLLTWEATTTGWVRFNIDPIVIATGTVMDLVGTTRKLTADPVTWGGDWDYTLPNNPTPPTAGGITHSNKGLDELWVHKTDDNAVDHSTDLAALAPGDAVTGAGMAWTVQANTDAGTYVILEVVPATQGSAGLHTFTFEHTPDVDLDYIRDPGYWVVDPRVVGLYSANGVYDDAATTDDAFGLDLEVQAANISDDWDVLSGRFSNTPAGQGVAAFGVTGVMA